LNRFLPRFFHLRFTPQEVPRMSGSTTMKASEQSETSSKRTPFRLSGTSKRTSLIAAQVGCTTDSQLPALAPEEPSIFNSASKPPELRVAPNQTLDLFRKQIDLLSTEYKSTAKVRCARNRCWLDAERLAAHYLVHASHLHHRRLLRSLQSNSTPSNPIASQNPAAAPSSEKLLIAANDQIQLRTLEWFHRLHLDIEILFEGKDRDEESLLTAKSLVRCQLASLKLFPAPETK
jgi:hypothetical protein